MTDELTLLLERAKRHDLEALDELVDRYANRLFGYLLRLTGHRDDAEELVQEVFVRLVRTIDRYRHDGRFDAWLFRIATNLARDRARTLKRRPTTGSLDDPGGADAPRLVADPDVESPDRSIQQKEDVDRLQQAMERLPETDRQVILLRHYSEMSFNEIAELMGTPIGTALARAHRALAKLRGWMEESK